MVVSYLEGQARANARAWLATAGLPDSDDGDVLDWLIDA